MNDQQTQSAEREASSAPPPCSAWGCGRSEDGLHFVSCEYNGVTLRQWGLSRSEAFESLSAVVDALSRNGGSSNED